MLCLENFENFFSKFVFFKFSYLNSYFSKILTNPRHPTSNNLKYYPSTSVTDAISQQNLSKIYIKHLNLNTKIINKLEK